MADIGSVGNLVNMTDMVNMANTPKAYIYDELPVILTGLASVTPWIPYLITALVLTYPFLCSTLRFRRRDAMHKKYNYHDKASLSRMTAEDAFNIMKYVAELEFPTFYKLSIQFGIFQVNFIPPATYPFFRRSKI